MWPHRGTLSRRKIQDREQQPSAPPKNVSCFTKLAAWITHIETRAHDEKRTADR
jgi:hypothetical protein